MNNLEIEISTEKTKLDLDEVKALLSQTYWADKRTKEIIRKSIENSVCYGVYNDNKLIGFGRVVTDYATVFWICDIIVDEKYRRNNIGKMLMKHIMNSDVFNGLLGILATRDAHGLYEKYGFVKDSKRFMIKERAIEILSP